MIITNDLNFLSTGKNQALYATHGTLVCLGLILWIFPKMYFFGRLPGDINIKGEKWSFHFPIITCIVVSIFISFLINFFSKK